MSSTHPIQYHASSRSSLHPHPAPTSHVPHVNHMAQGMTQQHQQWQWQQGTNAVSECCSMAIIDDDRTITMMMQQQGWGDGEEIRQGQQRYI